MKKKKEVKKPNNPVTFEIEKTKFNKVIKAQLDYVSMGNNILSGILFSITDNVLTFISTDGIRMLRTEVPIFSEIKTFNPAVYSSLYLGKIKIIKNVNNSKSKLDYLQITLKDKEMTILDMSNNISYVIPALEGKYPNCDKFLVKPKKNMHEYALNVRYLQDLKNLQVNEKTKIVTLTFNKKSSYEPVYIETENGEGIISTTLIMPIQVRK